MAEAGRMPEALVRRARRPGILLVALLGVVALLVSSTSAVPDWSAPAAAAAPMTTIPVPGSSMYGLVTGADGNLWYSNDSSVVRVTPAGNATAFSLGACCGTSLALGPDNAVWVATGTGLSRVATNGAVTAHVTGPGTGPWGVAVGLDSNLWFTNGWGNFVIGRMTTSGVVTTFPIAESAWGITLGPDGALWFAMAARVGRITTSGVVTYFDIPPIQALRLAPGPDGNLWVIGALDVVRLTPGGVATRFALPAQPTAIAAGPDGALWIRGNATANVGPFGVNDVILMRVTTDGQVTDFPRTHPQHPSGAIAVGPDGAIWYTAATAQGWLALGRLALDRPLTGVALESDRPTARVAQPIALTARVTKLGGAGAPSGTVTFSGLSGVLGSAPIVDSVATLRIASVSTSLAEVTADYPGDATFAGNASRALRIPTTRNQSYIALSPVNGAGPTWCDDYGNCQWAIPVTDPVVLQAVVFPDNPAGEPPPTALPTGTVTFRELSNGLGTLGTIPVANGLASLTVPTLPAGTHASFRVDYSGDANYEPLTTPYGTTVRVTAPMSPPSWRFEANDGPGNAAGSLDADVGAGASSVTYGGSPHVFYYDQDHGDLRHAWYSGGWRTETLDGANAGPHGQINANVGAQTSALAYGGQLQVFYYDATNGALRHAWWNGVQWSFEALDGTAGAVANGSVTGDVGGTPATNTYGIQVHAYYYDATNGDLRHAWWNGVRWGSETLDGSAGEAGRLTADVGRDVGLALYEGAPHAWYQDTTNADLRHAWWNGTQWRFETLDGNVDDPSAGRVSGEVGQHPSVLVFAGSPHVWYHDASQGTLRHGWWTGARWQFEILDGWGGWYGEVIADVGEDSAAMLYDDTPHVWYRDTTFGYLRHGWWDGEGWSFEALDGYTGGNGRVLGDVGNEPTVLPFAGQPHIWYQDATHGDLRHAWFD